MISAHTSGMSQVAFIDEQLSSHLIVLHDTNLKSNQEHTCNGDADAVVPVTSTRYSIDALNLSTISPYGPWYIDGQVDVKRAMSREEQSPGGSRPVSFNASRSFDSGANVRPKKIFVGCLPPALTSDEFRAYFETYGPVSDAVIMIDQTTMLPRGFGFLSFDSKDSVDLDLHKTFHDLNGKQVEVKRALPKYANPGVVASGGGGFPDYDGSGEGRVDSSMYMPSQNAGSGYPTYGGSGYGTGYGYGSNGVGYGGFGGYGNPSSEQ